MLCYAYTVNLFDWYTEMKPSYIFFVIIFCLFYITFASAGETTKICIPANSFLVAGDTESGTTEGMVKVIVEKNSLVTPQVLQIGKLLLNKKNGVRLYIPVLLITLGSGVLGVTVLAATATGTVGTLGMIETQPLTVGQVVGAALGVELTLFAIGSTILLIGVGLCTYRARQA